MAKIDFKEMQTSLKKVGNTLRGTGEVEFDSDVQRAGGAVRAFEVTYPEGTDRNLEVLAASVSNVSVLGKKVYFDAQLELSDNSNNHVDGGMLQALISAYLK